MRNQFSSLLAIPSVTILIVTLMTPSIALSDGTAPCNDGAVAKSTECGTNAITAGASNDATAVGAESEATGTGSTALGADAVASATRAHALGRDSVASATSALAVGANAQATGLHAVALGGGASSLTAARATVLNSIAIGGGGSGQAGALASAAGSIAIGNDSVASHSDSVAIGSDANTTEPDQIVLGSTTTFQIDSVGRVGAGVDPSAPLDVLTNAVEIGLGNAVAKFSNSDGAVAFQLDPNDDGQFWNVSVLASNDQFNFSRNGTGSQEMTLDANGNMVLRGTITTTGPTCSAGCDAVFDPGYNLPTIADHAKKMWADQHLPAVGPTQPGTPVDLSEQYGTLLNELEIAHIYIHQLHTTLAEQQARLDALETALLDN